MDTDLIITIVGLSVAGLAAVLGIWVERDKTKPPRYAYALSILILLATIVGMYQCYADAKQGEKLEADMARMLQMLDKISAESEVPLPELDSFVKTEIAAQSRANPKVVTKLAQRVADEGGDPQQMLAKHLPASEVEEVQRKGTLSVKPATVKPTIALTPKPDGTDGPTRPMRLLRKGDEEAAAAAPSGTPSAEPTATPSGSAAAGEPPPQVAPKAGLLKPSLGGAKPDDTAKAAATPKPTGATAPKTDAPKLTPKPKL